MNTNTLRSLFPGSTGQIGGGYCTSGLTLSKSGRFRCSKLLIGLFIVIAMTFCLRRPVFAATSTVTVQGGANELKSYIGSGKYSEGAYMTLDGARKSTDGTFGWYVGSNIKSAALNCNALVAGDADYTPVGTYSITYDLDGGDWSSTAGKTSYTSQDEEYTIPNPYRSGYSCGWTGSNGSTKQAPVTLATGSVGNKSYTANWIPGGGSYVKVDNVINFINSNKNTTQQICFQGNGSGKFYVKAGSFTNKSNPGITSGGTLIYDAGGADKGAALDNYKCAAHLANVMNYILYNTKGSSYGSNDAKFTDSPTSSSYTELNSSTMPKGFYNAHGGGSYFDCDGRGYTGYYSYSYVYSDGDHAVWW